MSEEEQAISVVTVIPTRVEIESGGHRVAIESPASLNKVAKKAVELWHSTDDKAVTRGQGAVGFHTELAVVDSDDDGIGFRAA